MKAADHMEKVAAVAKADALAADLEKEKKTVKKIDATELDAAVKTRVSVMDAGKKFLAKEEIAKSLAIFSSVKSSDATIPI